MLLDQAKRITERVAQYQASKERAQYAQTFETRAGQLYNSASRLRDAVAAMEALNASGIPVAFSFAGNDQTRAKTAELKEGFANDPAFVDDPGFNIQFDYVKPLGGLADSIKTAALKAWQAHVDARRERVSSDILDALRAVHEYRTIVSIVYRAQQEIDRLAAALPPNIALAEAELSKLTQQQLEAWQQLTGGALPDSVILFLRASMGEGADLRLLTPEVIDWLNSRKLDGAFRIKPRNAV